MIAISRLIIPALEPERRRVIGDIPLCVSCRERGRRFTRQAFPSTPMPRPVPGPIPRRYGSALRFPALNAKVDLWV
jgi:hypothetical protein